MKLGLYATTTYTTCQGRPGSLGHENVDAADFVSWGVDYVKYDDCPYGPKIIGPDGHDYYTQGIGRELTRSIYARVQDFRRALDAASAAQNRPKVTLSVSAQPVHSGVPHLLASDDPARTDPVVVAAGTPSARRPATRRPASGAARSPTCAGSAATGGPTWTACCTTASCGPRSSTRATSGPVAGMTWT